jgi:Na+/melibiose symporter-like transporter
MLTIQKNLTKSFFIILGLPSTAMGFALSIQIAVLSWILRTKYGLEIHEIGFVWAAGPIAGIIGQPIIGLISDKIWFWGGRRRPFIIIGGILAAMSILALPFLDKINDLFGIGSLMAVAITVALTLDLSINISFNPTRSIIADVTPEGRPRTKGYTWMQSISNLFGSLAYLTGALLGNYTLIFSGAVIVFLFSIIPLFFIKEPRELTPETKNGNGKEEATKTQWGELFKLYFAHGFSWLGIQTMFIYIIAFIEQKIHPQTDIETGQMIGWSFFILNAVGFIWPVFLLEPVSKRIGRVRTHILCVASMSLGYFGIVLWAHNAILLYTMMAILTFGWAAVVSLPFAIMSEKVNKVRMGLFMGIFNLSVVLPQLGALFYRQRDQPGGK